jgi:cysteine synthase A
MDILRSIGNTSLIRLRKVVPPDCADVFVKLEWENPTGSVKDRMALAVITRAEADGRLKPGDTVVEYTGEARESAALVCAARATHQDVSSDAFSGKSRSDGGVRRRADALPSEGGLTTKKLILDMIRRPRPEPRASHLLDRSAQQPRQHRRLFSAR